MADDLECTVSAIADFAQFGYATACDYVQTACADETTIVDFFGLYYCQLNESVPAFVGISFLFVLFIFYMISSTAEDYLEPVVSQISTKLRLSESLAGVTLVALANGAPDVIAAFAAGGNEDQGVLVPLGGLLGAGIFTISMILAVCILFSPSKTIKTEKSALTRDCVFYLIGALYVLGLGIYGEINLWGTMGFFVQYCVFLCVVLYQEAQYRKNLHKKNMMKSDGPSFVLEYGQDVEFEDHNLLHSLMKDNHVRGENNGINYDESVMSGGLPGSKIVKANNTNLRWRYNILKHNVWREFEQVEDSSIFGKILYVLLYPFKLARDLTIPATSSENWSKWKTVLQPFFLLPFFVWQAGYLGDLMASKTAVIVLVCSCLVISALLWKFTATKNAPSGLFGLAMMGLAFSSGVVWINLVANMLVDFIALLAVFTNLPLNFLGLTLVAFGGSVPDFFVDLTLAKKGLGQTAASGIFAGQYFNLGIGFGAALTRQVLVYGPRPFQLLDGSNTAIINLVLVGCLVGGLIVALGYGKFKKYVYGKGFATYSLFLYAAFLGSVTFLSF